MKPLESEINKWTKTARVQSTKAENESENTDYEGDNVLLFAIFSEINLVLHFQAELRECEEREEGRHEDGRVEMRVVAEVERRELESKEPLDEQPRKVDALDAEEAAREDDNEECEKHARNRAQTLIEFLQK